MSRNHLFWLSAGLAVAGVVCLLFGISLMNKDIRSHVAGHHRQYLSDADGTYYACEGSPNAVAGQLAQYKQPEARASDRGTEYLRYKDEILIVGPDGFGRSCSIRVEDINARYSQGGFIFLGSGFNPGSPAGGSGGSPGGPDGSK
jgi:Domain of unknown function (DUF4247)